jgi:hypothetical protein
MAPLTHVLGTHDVPRSQRCIAPRARLLPATDMIGRTPTPFDIRAAHRHALDRRRVPLQFNNIRD